ncbi:hypothetical protein IP88_08420 [alpha proteobacterium AAP81b]|nr:hypothetical protein IP88_08420 [alpha proteobacterium AAP81b]
MVAGPALAEDAPAAPPALGPALAGPLSYSDKPISFEAGSLGDIYITGIGTGFLGTQSNSTVEAASFADISNAAAIIQKADGVVQFLVHVGAYNHETLGFSYTKATRFTDLTYGVVPQAYVKLVPSANFSIQAGIMPTMIGLEGPFTFQNMNIDRGMLWGQENVLTRQVQANFTTGKLALSLSFGDGFFSGKWNWISGLATYTFNSSNALTVVAGGPTSTNYKSTFATPVFQNNSTIVDVIYSYSSGKFLIQPYFQYTSVPALPLIGTDGAESWSGAVLARYNFSDSFSLPVRFEYIDTKAKGPNAASLINGPGANAFSFTITPTYKWKQFFVRPEFSVVSASDVTPGLGFGRDGLAKSQVRGRLEFGVIF